MVKFYLSILFILLSLSIYCQEITPFFELPLYFEDAAGNKDTVVLGADPAASTYLLLPDLFSEYEILEPVDSVFEVLLKKPYYYSGYSKRAISYMISNEPNCLTYSAFAQINIIAENLPVTVSYNSEVINDTWCNPLFAIFRYDAPDPNEPPFMHHCATYQNSIELNLSTYVSVKKLWFAAYWDRGLDGWPTCDTTVVSLDTFETNKFVNVWYNRNGKLFIETSQNINHIEIYNLNGQLVFKTENHLNQINIQHLNSGLYVIQLKDDKGNRYRQKFAKS